MNKKELISILFAIVLLVVGLLNIFLVHPVPGIIYIILSFLYTPQANTLLWKKLGSLVAPIVKIILAIVIIIFTLGVSDLGDMIDKL